MRSTHALALPFFVLLTVGGCTTGGSDGPDDPAAADHELRTAAPVASPVSSTDVPAALAGRPSASKVKRAAEKGASDRLGAEEFALLLSQASVDVSRPVDMAELLDDVGCDSLPAGDREALVTDVTRQAAAGFQRQWDLSEPLWIRSQQKGKAYSFEIAGVYMTGDRSFAGWDRSRTEVRRSEDGWCVDGLASVSFGPEALAQEGEDSDIRDSLEGPGWRAVGP